MRIGYKSNKISSIRKKKYDIKEDDEEKIRQDLLRELSTKKQINEFKDVQEIIILVHRLLNANYPLQSLPISLFHNVLFHFIEQFDANLMNIFLEIIIAAGSLDDDKCIQFINDELIQNLFRIITTSSNLGHIIESLHCISLFIEPDKPKTISKFDGNSLFNLIFSLITKIINFSENEPVISESLNLLTNAVKSYAISDDISQSIINLIFQILKQDNASLKSSAIRTMSIITHDKEPKIKFYLIPGIHQFLCDSILIDQTIAKYSFSSIYNFCLHDLNFTLQIVLNSPFLSFIPTNEWDIDLLIIYCKSFSRIFQRIGECKFQNLVDVNVLNLLLTAVRNNIENLIPVIISFVDEASFVLKKWSLNVLCQLIMICDKEIIMLIMNGHLELIECLIEVLNINDFSLIKLSLRTLRTLIQFGDDIADEMNLKNMFYLKALECSLENVCCNVMENFSESGEITKILEALDKVMEKCQDRAEIDGCEEEYVIEYEI